MTNNPAERNSRTVHNLENVLRMTFLPTGVREFMKGINRDLNLGPTQSSIQLGIATSCDIAKYTLYLAEAYNLFYR